MTIHAKGVSVFLRKEVRFVPPARQPDKFGLVERKTEILMTDSASDSIFFKKRERCLAPVPRNY